MGRQRWRLGCRSTPKRLRESEVGTVSEKGGGGRLLPKRAVIVEWEANQLASPVGLNTPPQPCLPVTIPASLLSPSCSSWLAFVKARALLLRQRGLHRRWRRGSPFGAAPPPRPAALVTVASFFKMALLHPPAGGGAADAAVAQTVIQTGPPKGSPWASAHPSAGPTPQPPTPPPFPPREHTRTWRVSPSRCTCKMV
jgi:hypothetical protein